MLLIAPAEQLRLEIGLPGIFKDCTLELIKENSHLNMVDGFVDFFRR